MYFLYSLLTAIAALIASPYYFLKGLRTGKYLGNLGERMGRVPPSVRARAQEGGSIWLHAVSVGEVIAGVPLARALKQRFPTQPLIISTTTQTGQKVARERLGFADAVFYFPLDWAWMVKRVLRAIRPASVIVLETEIWPNFLREARRAGAPVIFVNGRLSDRSFARYQRLLGMLGFLLRGFFRRVLSNGALFAMQSQTDAERIRALGAPADRVTVTGNLKYDSPAPSSSPLETWLAESVLRQNRRPLIVAGSVVAAEEPLVLRAFGVLKKRMPDALLVLAPRKPERFEIAAQETEGADYRFVRRSNITGDDPKSGVLPKAVEVFLLDSIGELAGLYRLADAVFVGGSLVAAGGHNILEPAACGRPPVFGPSMENFRGIARTFIERGAAREVTSAEDLGAAWIELVEHPELSRKMGDAARELVEASRGATARTLAQIEGVLGASSTDYGEPAPLNNRETSAAAPRAGRGGA
jgi:3-deoxy-D-manno-octulosonic-acid transferase